MTCEYAKAAGLAFEQLVGCHLVNARPDAAILSQLRLVEHENLSILDFLAEGKGYEIKWKGDYKSIEKQIARQYNGMRYTPDKTEWRHNFNIGFRNERIQLVCFEKDKSIENALLDPASSLFGKADYWLFSDIASDTVFNDIGEFLQSFRKNGLLPLLENYSAVLYNMWHSEHNKRLIKSRAVERSHTLITYMSQKRTVHSYEMKHIFGGNDPLPIDIYYYYSNGRVLQGKIKRWGCPDLNRDDVVPNHTS